MNAHPDRDLHWLDSLREALRAACLVEATARKPGNVHPEARFADLCYDHFRIAADAVVTIADAPVPVGRAICRAVEATRERAPGNVNLGIVLLLAPLAAVPQGVSLAAGIGDVLEALTADDAEMVYRAIRLANPGGLGKVAEGDVAEAPTGTLLDAMRLAEQRDRVAYQYSHAFSDVLQFGMPLVVRAAEFGNGWEQAVIRLHLELLARFPDSLIARKCGNEFALEASTRAREVLEGGWPDGPEAARKLARFDEWLRADGNRRNPGTTADLVAASLFAAYRERLLGIPDWAQRQ